MRVFADMWAYLSDGGSWSGSGGILALLGQSLLLTFTAMVIAVAAGLPVALWLGHLGRGGFVAINISAVGRAVPTFALLGLLVTADWPGTGEFGPFGRAGLATLIALALFALPPIITNAYTAVVEVPVEVKEAARGMGMTGSQRFWRAELPLALPLVVGGVRLALVQVWATATIAALVAGPGIGNIIREGFANSQYGKGLGGAVIVAVVALVLEVGAAAAQRAVTPARVRSRSGRGARTREPAGA